MPLGMWPTGKEIIWFIIPCEVNVVTVDSYPKFRLSTLNPDVKLEESVSQSTLSLICCFSQIQLNKK